MSASELPPGVESRWDPIFRRWLVSVPVEFLERSGYRLANAGSWYSKDHVGFAGGQSAAAIGKSIAMAIANPGPIQRDAREKVAKNNRRRWGPR